MGAVQHGHAAIGEAGDDLGFEKEIGGVQRRVREAFPDHIDVIGNARRPPHVGDPMAVARVDAGHDLHYFRVQVFPVAEAAALQRLVHPGLDEAGRIRGGMHDQVIAGLAGHQLGVHDLRGVVDVVIDPDAVFPFKIGNGGRADVIRPVVHVDDFFFRRRGDARKYQKRQQNRHSRATPVFTGAGGNPVR